MAAFIQISNAFVNVDTIERIEEQGAGQGCTLVFSNAHRLQIKEDAREVIKRIEEAQSGRRIPSLSPDESSPLVH